MASRHGLAFAPRVSVFHGSNANVIAIKAFIRITTSIRLHPIRCDYRVCMYVRVCFEVERKASFPVPSNLYVGIKSVRKSLGNRRSDRGCTILLAIPILPVSKARVYCSISIREGSDKEGEAEESEAINRV